MRVLPKDTKTWAHNGAKPGAVAANHGRGLAEIAALPYKPAPEMSSRYAHTVFPRALLEGETPEHRTVDGYCLYVESRFGTLHAYRHGNKSTYSAGCCCDECRHAYKTWETRNFSEHKYRQRQKMVSAEESAIKLQEMRDTGISWKQLGIVVGVTHYTLIGILEGRPNKNGELIKTKKVYKTTHEAIMNAEIDPEKMTPLMRIDDSLTVARIRSLYAEGYTQKQLNELRGRKFYSYCILETQTRGVTVKFAKEIRELYQRLGPPAKPHANSLRVARERGWVVPMAWDDPGTLVWPKYARRFNV